MPFMSQITRWPVELFCQRMSALPSPLKSPEPAMLHDVVYRSQTDRGLKRGAIHEPDNALASGVVLPKNVRLAVPVKVARTSDAPRCRYRSQIDRGLKRGAIHEPDNALASGVVLPKNVRLAVPVKVARTSDAPRCLYRSQTDRGLKRGAIHEPDNALASGVVLPKNVRLAVPVEVFVCARNNPYKVEFADARGP